MLTEYLSWRWCLYVNLMFAGVGIVGALALLHNVRPGAPAAARHRRARCSASAGLFSLVYGFSHASTTSWCNGR